MAGQDTQLATQEGNTIAIRTAEIRTPAPLSPAMTVQQAVNAHKMILDIVQNAMVEGHDYGIVPGTKSKMLFKPGAERLCSIFQLAVRVVNIQRDFDSDAGFLEYTVTIELINRRTGEPVGQGIGCCNSHEKKYRNVDAANVANTLLKMAKKRALSEGVLPVTGASGIFQLDEDEIENLHNSHQNQRGSSNGNGRSNQSAQRGAPRQLPPPQPPPQPRLMTPEQRSEIERLAPSLHGANWQQALEQQQEMPFDDWGQKRANAVVESLREQVARPLARGGEAPVEGEVVGESDADAFDDSDPFQEE